MLDITMAVTFSVYPCPGAMFAYTSMPPAPPPVMPRLGGYCLKATVHVTDHKGCPIARVTGFNKSPSVGKDTELACKQHVRTLRGKKYVCGEAGVTLLHNTPQLCTGEYYWSMGDTTKRL